MHDSFCGWYFKCQSAEQTLAMIPAVHISGGEQTCSIQIIGDQGSWNVPLSRVQPRIQKNKPYAALGENFFCPDGVRLDLHARGASATGQLRFGPPAPSGMTSWGLSAMYRSWNAGTAYSACATGWTASCASMERNIVLPMGPAIWKVIGAAHFQSIMFGHSAAFQAVP